MSEKQRDWNIIEAQDLLAEIKSAQSLIVSIYELYSCGDVLSSHDNHYLIGLYLDQDIRGKLAKAEKFLEMARGQA